MEQFKVQMRMKEFGTSKLESTADSSTTAPSFSNAPGNVANGLSSTPQYVDSHGTAAVDFDKILSTPMESLELSSNKSTKSRFGGKFFNLDDGDAGGVLPGRNQVHDGLPQPTPTPAQQSPVNQFSPSSRHLPSSSSLTSLLASTVSSDIPPLPLPPPYFMLKANSSHIESLAARPVASINAASDILALLKTGNLSPAHSRSLPLSSIASIPLCPLMAPTLPSTVSKLKPDQRLRSLPLQPKETHSTPLQPQEIHSTPSFVPISRLHQSNNLLNPGRAPPTQIHHSSHSAHVLQPPSSNYFPTSANESGIGWGEDAPSVPTDNFSHLRSEYQTQTSGSFLFDFLIPGARPPPYLNARPSGHLGGKNNPPTPQINSPVSVALSDLKSHGPLLATHSSPHTSTVPTSPPPIPNETIKSSNKRQTAKLRINGNSTPAPEQPLLKWFNIAADSGQNSNGGSPAVLGAASLPLNVLTVEELERMYRDK